MDLDNRLCKASTSFGRLSQRVWQSHSLRLSTKIQIYTAVVVPTLLHGAEAWVVYRKVGRATRVVPSTMLALHLRHQMARPLFERSSRQESQPAQHKFHLASGAAALGWLCHKDGRRTHAQSSLLQRAPRRKARSWCSAKAVQRSAEETACTGGNQPSVMAAGGLRPRQLALISEFPHCCKFETERHETAKERRRKQKERAFHPFSSQTFVCPKCGRGCASRIGLYSHQRACKN